LQKKLLIIRPFLIFIFFYLNSFFAYSQQSADFKLFLIGDAGENDTTGTALKDLQTQLLANPNSAVIFLGDNCYKKALFGLIKTERKGFDGSKLTKKKLMSQLSILKDYKGSAYFIPGNHDWWNCISVKKGKRHLLAEQFFIEDTLKHFTGLINCNDAAFLPENGMAGPVSREFNKGKIKIIFIDTYRLILEEIKKKKKNIEMINSFYKDLEDQLKKAADKKQKIIIAAHHPVYSKGKHSQPIKFWHKPVKRFANSNSNYGPNKKIAGRIDSLLKLYNNNGSYYVSGHEHSLEYFYKDKIRYIVSGSGSKVDKVEFESIQNTYEFLKWNAAGFFEIVFFNDREKVLMYSRKTDKSVLEVDCLQGCDK
jgi:hypothetical protein